MRWFSRRHKRYVFYSAAGLALLGALTSMAAMGLRWEEQLGLYLLFQMRGARPAPDDIVIVSLDRQSARELGIPAEPQKWPRSLHARLVDILKEKGARVVVFDVVFREKRDTADDQELTRAIAEAANTVLCEYLRKDRMPWDAERSWQGGLLDIEHAIPPFAELKAAAAASAPFPLPQKPYRVNQYWAFKPGAGDQPTLPVAAFQVFADRALPLLIETARRLLPPEVFGTAAGDRDVLDVEARIRQLRAWIKHAPDATARLTDTVGSPDPLLQSLIRLYTGPDSRYLNFYGPAGTIRTVPYYEVIRGQLSDPDFSFAQKAVFIGLSERFRTEQRDDFHTVFSQESGPDMSGVEIAATAFGNLLEGRSVEPVTPAAHLWIVVGWGLLLGIVCVRFRSPVALSITAGLGLLYLTGIHQLFSRNDIWAPVVVPLTIQTPIAFGISLFLAYLHLKEERRRITAAAGYYLPEQVVADLSSMASDIGERREKAFGICLVTDAARYTQLSEQLLPERLSALLNRYYEALFRPVRARGGLISDVVGDSMMAIWASPPAESVDRNQACLAALEILESVERFNRSHKDIQLPTRIGLHSGQIVLGNVGAVDHFEYRAVGDVVNSASRLEGLNKHLGTHILLSRAVAKEVEGLETRYVGRFLPSGKAKPMEVFELTGRQGHLDPEHRELHHRFADALRAFEQGRWDDALEGFSRCLNLNGGDGPSAFYQKLCDTYRQHPPDGPLEAVPMDTK